MFIILDIDPIITIIVIIISRFLSDLSSISHCTGLAFTSTPVREPAKAVLRKKNKSIYLLGFLLFYVLVRVFWDVFLFGVSFLLYSCNLSIIVVFVFLNSIKKKQLHPFFCLVVEKHNAWIVLNCECVSRKTKFFKIIL